jgi:hypothetical protein
VAITYTTNLTLPIVPADNTNWEAEYNAMIQKLDRNPGRRIVADEAAMNALTPFNGRMCYRVDLAATGTPNWQYVGVPGVDGQWQAEPGQTAADLPAFMPMKDTVQETTAVVAPETSENGTINFDYFPGVGEEVQLYMVQVTPDAAGASVSNEEVTLEDETAMRLDNKPATSIDETGDEVGNIIVKSSTSMGEQQTLDLGGRTAAPISSARILATPAKCPRC